MQENNHLKSLLVFAVFAAASYAVYESQFAKDSEWAFKPFTKGYALHDSEIQMTGDLGQIHTSITSPEVVYYADSEETHITQPVIVYQAGETDWQVQSSKAMINDDQSEILFPESVEMRSLNQEQETTIKTKDLTLYPGSKVAKTKAHISMLNQNMSMEGEGSVIDLNQQEIQVLDETHAEFNR